MVTFSQNIQDSMEAGAVQSLNTLLAEHQEQVSASNRSETAAAAFTGTKPSKSARRAAQSTLAPATPASPSATPCTSSSNPDLMLSNPIAYLKQQSSLNDDGVGGSLIALIGLALTLQVKENSQFYSSMFQQATMSMEAAVAFAPLIYSCVISKYNNQASQTQAQADSAKWQAIVQYATGGILLVMGAMEFIKKLPETSPELKATDNTSDDDNIGKQEAADTDAALSPEEKAAKAADTDIENDVDQNLTTSQKVTRQLGAAKSAVKSKIELFAETFESATKKAQVLQLFSQPTCQMIDNNYKNQEVVYIQKMGAADAESQELQQYAQYYNQRFSQTDSLREGSQNNIDTAMQILKSIADAMTQTTQSLFRG